MLQKHKTLFFQFNVQTFESLLEVVSVVVLVHFLWVGAMQLIRGVKEKSEPHGLVQF